MRKLSECVMGVELGERSSLVAHPAFLGLYLAVNAFFQVAGQN
ncbi:MAG: hypothetical protein ACR2NZ_08250 [Rubripirellula sp.]